MKKNFGRPRQFDPEDFLRSCQDVFWSKGYKSTTMADLINASGVASASIYKLYPDKKSIFLAALSQYMQAGLDRMSKRVSEASTPEVALRETLDYCALLSIGEDGEKGCFTIAAATELVPIDKDVSMKVEYMFSGIKDNLSQIIMSGQKNGCFRDDVDASVLVDCLFMNLEGMRVYGKVRPNINQLKNSNNFLINSILSKPLCIKPLLSGGE
ncbi:TPA: TetR/AcrR family transcriptional regulator [Enterobacter hormaechei subsp. xiangfangensis]|nr:TetR/AcrR family transcriptional regulator [Enterobacter hormaechei subsp. xiangfangensis]